jgi:hypothetical protein|tara:strand:+ start:404 stop:580 length:177 start_codon:yes stop_codon:yes gene_type:complete
MSKGSTQRVRWSSTFAKQYDKIFGKKHVFDLRDVISPKEVELDLNFKGGHKTKKENNG